MEKKVRDLLKQVKTRQKNIERSMEYAYETLNENGTNIGLVEHYAKDLHDYAVILNELKNMEIALKGILSEAEEERNAATPDGWYYGDHIIFCKDCKYFDEENCFCTCSEDEVEDEYYFCADAERR